MGLILAKCSQTPIFIHCPSDHFTIKLFLSDVHLFMAQGLQKAAQHPALGSHWSVVCRKSSYPLPGWQIHQGGARQACQHTSPFPSQAWKCFFRVEVGQEQLLWAQLNYGNQAIRGIRMLACGDKEVASLFGLAISWVWAGSRGDGEDWYKNLWLCLWL